MKFLTFSWSAVAKQRDEELSSSSWLIRACIEGSNSIYLSVPCGHSTEKFHAGIWKLGLSLARHTNVCVACEGKVTVDVDGNDNMRHDLFHDVKKRKRESGHSCCEGSEQLSLDVQ